MNSLAQEDESSWLIILPFSSHLIRFHLLNTRTIPAHREHCRRVLLINKVADDICDKESSIRYFLNHSQMQVPTQVFLLERMQHMSFRKKQEVKFKV